MIMREFGSEFPAIQQPDNYFLKLTKYGHCVYLRSGREALAVSALNIPRKSNVILFPAYCCSSMSAPFVELGWNLVYYRITEALGVDLNHLSELLEVHKPDAILVMNYFGIAATNDAVSMIKSYNGDCTVVEDFSHLTFSFPDIYNPDVDFYVSSIRKSCGITDGAVVISRKEIDIRAVVESCDEYANERMYAQKMKWQYKYTGDLRQKDTFRSVLGQLVDDLGREKIVPHHISLQGAEMLKTINSLDISFSRKENFKHLLNILRDEQGITFPLKIDEALRLAPFSLPILVENRNQMQMKLASKGLYAPVLWPILKEASDVCPVSKKMAEGMLSLPIDQRYDYNDVEDIGRIVIDTLTEMRM